MYMKDTRTSVEMRYKSRINSKIYSYVYFVQIETDNPMYKVI